MAVLSALRHPRIIRLFGTQQVQDRMICLIMEYAPGGSLKTYLDTQENRIISEEEAKYFFEQMVNAVDYCHRRYVSNLSESCGTIEFTAPEVLSRQEYNGAAADMWSLGAVVYEMLMELRMTMEEVVCHPWLLGEIAPAEEASAPGREYSEQQPTKSNNLSRGGSGGVCLRHNSLRLVVPGSEDFLTELDEAAISDAGAPSRMR
ncbi:hypothetical protein N2152v2_006365 [Parachlorella kessleri]